MAPPLDPPAATIADTRRATVRIMAHETLRALATLARANGGDTIGLLVFTGIWSANTEHLLPTNRYGGLHDIPPDSQHQPIPEAELARMLCMPPEIVGAYVERLIAGGLAERTAAGLHVPAAVFSRPEMMNGTNEMYARAMGMVAALRRAGFQFGDATDAKISQT
jgi:hypothetical protein